MKIFLCFFLFVFSFSFEFSVNSGLRNLGSYSILHIKNKEPFSCVMQILKLDKKRYICMFENLNLPKYENLNLALADIFYKKENNKLFLIINPKVNSRLYNLDLKLYDDIKNTRKDKSQHFSILLDNNLSEFDSIKQKGLNFIPNFNELILPHAPAVDVNKEPIIASNALDVDAFLNLKKLFEMKNLKSLLEESQIAIDKFKDSIFRSEFMLYKLRALNELLKNDHSFENFDNHEIIDSSKKWLRNFNSNNNYPEILYILSRAYIRENRIDDARYIIDILKKEQGKSDFSKLAELEYGDYLYNSIKKEDGIKIYNDVLYSTNNIQIASKAALRLADVNVKKDKFDEARKYILKILKANKEFFLSEEEKSLDLAFNFSKKKYYDLAGKIYESLLMTDDKKSKIYELSLRYAALNFAKANDFIKADKYSKLYEKEFRNGDFLDEISKVRDELFFELGESDPEKLHKHYADLMSKYEGQELAKKALIGELELDIKEKKFKKALSFSNLIKDNKQINDLITKAALLFSLQSLKDDNCIDAVKIIETYGVSNFLLPNLKLYDCFYRTSRQEKALKLARANLDSGDIFNQIYWLINASKSELFFKNYKEVLTLSNKGLELANQNQYADASDLLFDRFQAEIGLSRLLQAKKTLNIISKLNDRKSKIVESYYQLSEAEFKFKNFREAQRLSKEGLNLQNDILINTFSPDLNFILARSNFNLGKYDTALDEVIFILNSEISSKQRVAALNLISQIYIKLGNIQEAKSHLNQCINGDFDDEDKENCKASLELLK